MDLHVVSGDSTDHGLPHALQLQQCAMNLSMVSSGSTDYGHQQSPLLLHGPGTSKWPRVTAQTTNINTDLSCSKTTDSDTALGDRMNPNITMASDREAVQGQPYGLQ